MYYLYFILVVTAAALTSGCVPFPHSHRLSSEIHGRVQNGDDLLTGISVKRVLALGSENCERPGETVVTNADGRFVFDGRYEFRAIVPLYGDPIAPMILCLYRGSELLGTSERILIGGAPPEMEVVCDLELAAGGYRDAVCGPENWIRERRREIHDRANS